MCGKEWSSFGKPRRGQGLVLVAPRLVPEVPNFVVVNIGFGNHVSHATELIVARTTFWPFSGF